MKIKINKSKCTLCGMCVASCPVDAINIDNEVNIDTTRCIGCRMCLVSCPQKAVTSR